ncbi:MAG: WYL domain-containing protein [Bacilli bacterium]|nr:WYL domain-containing protein [Bacilli bacterium]
MEKLYEKNGNILYILNVLRKYSDEDHMLSAKEIKNIINENYNVEVDERTIRRNINLLIEKFDYDISTRKDNNKGYYLLRDPDTDFEVGEIRTIMDTISFATYITPKISRNIINKCLNMLNIYEEEKFNNYKVYSDNVKTSNIAVIKNMEDINEAIYNKKKITFNYNKYYLDSNKLSNIVVDTVVVSPYAIFYTNQEFYLIALKEGNDKLYSYRIDRISSLKVLKKDISNRIKANDVKEFMDSSVSMFAGNPINITVRCHVSLLDNVVDLFGKKLDFKTIDKDIFKVTLNVNKEGFKYWVLRNIEKVDVVEPFSLKQEIKEILIKKTK